MRADRALLVLALTGALAGGARAEGERRLTAFYPEGPLWSGESLYYAEMRADRVARSDSGGARTFFHRAGCGPTAIAPYGDGFLILCHLGGEAVAVDRGGAALRSWDADVAGRPLENPNDATADGAGGVYFTDPGPFTRDARARGRIMHLSSDGVLRSVAGPLRYPNGAAFHDGALYVSEHLRGRVLRYGVKPGGDLGRADTFVDLSGLDRSSRYEIPYALAGPDGLEFGPDGFLYVAIYGEGRLIRISAEGDVVGNIEVTARFLTNVAFGPAGVALTGTFDNRAPPYHGEVVIMTSLP